MRAQHLDFCIQRRPKQLTATMPREVVEAPAGGLAAVVWGESPAERATSASWLDVNEHAASTIVFESMSFGDFGVRFNLQL